MAKSSGKAGSLFYGMTLDTKEFKKRLKDARKTLKAAGEEMRAAMSAIGSGFAVAGAAIAGAGAGMLFFAKSTAEATNEQILLADSIGATQSEIAGLQLASTRWGVSNDMLIDKMREAGGIDAFKDIADQVEGAGDATKQLAKAQELLGNEGLKLLPILQQGSAGLAAMEREAQALGLALSPKQIEENNVAWTQFENTMLKVEGLSKQIGTGFLEAFGKMSAGVDAFVDAFGTDIKSAFSELGDFMADSIGSALKLFNDKGIPFINSFISFANGIGETFSTVFSFIRGEGDSTFSFLGSFFDGFIDVIATFKQTFISGAATAISTVIDGAFSLVAKFSDFLGGMVTTLAKGLEAIGLEEEGFSKHVAESFKEQGDNLRNIGKEWADGLKIVADEQSTAAADILEKNRKKNESQQGKFTSVIGSFTTEWNKINKTTEKVAETNKKVAEEMSTISASRATSAVSGSQEEFKIRTGAKTAQQVAQRQLSETKKMRMTLDRIEAV